MMKRNNPIISYYPGFTLIEFIVVISLFSFLFAFSFPSLTNLRKTLIGKTVVQKISSQMRIAKIEALNNRKTTKIVFDIAQNKYIYTNSSGSPLTSNTR